MTIDDVALHANFGEQRSSTPTRGRVPAPGRGQPGRARQRGGVPPGQAGVHPRRRCRQICRPPGGTVRAAGRNVALTAFREAQSPAGRIRTS